MGAWAGEQRATLARWLRGKGAIGARGMCRGASGLRPKCHASHEVIPAEGRPRIAMRRRGSAQRETTWERHDAGDEVPITSPPMEDHDPVKGELSVASPGDSLVAVEHAVVDGRVVSDAGSNDMDESWHANKLSSPAPEACFRVAVHA